MNTLKGEITCTMKAETQEQKLAGDGAIRVIGIAYPAECFFTGPKLRKESGAAEKSGRATRVAVPIKVW